MNRNFSQAAERVLQQAARWRQDAESPLLELPAVLLALSFESECRAARLLAGRGISPELVRQRWPDLRLADDDTEVPREMLDDLQRAIRAIEDRLHELPQPLELATEHLLLGMLAVPGEVADWLTEQGLSLDELEREIYRLHDFSPGPIDVDWEVGRSAECGMRSAESVAPDEAESKRVASGSGDVAVLRILDAAANRAREGLRVIEDFVRFALDDAHLTERFKRLRHELAGLLSALAHGDLLAARETRADVGTQLSLASEQSRADCNDVLAANFKRVQESLRTLEEYSKTMSAEFGRGFEQLRYQIYTLERAVFTTTTSLDRLGQARLYVLIDARSSPEEFDALAEALVQARVDILQLRDKRLDDRQLLHCGRRLRSITAASETLFIMNDRPDLAVLCKADGVHVGQEELQVKEVRSIVGGRLLVGVSTHSLEQARQAVLDGADYIGVGPTFASTTKAFEQFTGLDLLAEVSREIRLPAFAIGGIALDNLPTVQAAGFRRVAVSGAILGANDPAAAAQSFLQQLNSETAQRGSS